METSRKYRDSVGLIREEYPVYSAKEGALRDGRAFLASTGMVNVIEGQSLYLMLSNPSDSGRNIIVDERWFDNNRASGGVPLEYTAFINPTAVLTNATVSANLLTGQPAGAGVLTYQANASITMGGTQGSAAPLPTGGTRQIIDLGLIMPPGAKLGFRIDGGGQTINQAVRIGMTFVWHEEALP